MNNNMRILIISAVLMLVTVCSVLADIQKNGFPWQDVFDSSQSLKGDAAVKIPDSVWFQQEKKLYSDFLTGEQFDILVVPFQVQHLGFDRIGRSIMAAELAYEIARLTKMRVPDPYLVARAMGDGERRYSLDETLEFANRLGVSKVVSGFVGHDGKGRMKLTIQINSRKQGASQWSDEKNIKQYDWKDLVFTDKKIPIEVFGEMLPEILEKTGLASWKPVPDYVAASKQTEIPTDPLQIYTLSDGQIVEKAHYLTLLGLLSPNASTRNAERIFERVLVMLDQLQGQSEEIRLLRARALLHLHRRPVALLQLEGLNSNEARGLTAISNGNLTGLHDIIRNVNSPVQRLSLAIEGNDLAFNYTGKPLEGVSALVDSQFMESQSWGPLIQRRLRDLDVWSVSGNEEVKRLLDDAFPIDGYALQDLIAGQIVIGNATEYYLNVALSPIRHLRKILAGSNNTDCCPRTAGVTGCWDYMDLLEALSTSNLLKDVRKKAFVLSKYSIARQALDKYDVIYAGHPEFALQRAYIAAEQMKDAKPGESDVFLQERRKNATLAAYYEHGQSRVSEKAIKHMGLGSSEYSLFQGAYLLDFPMRKYWDLYGPKTFGNGPNGNPYYQNVMSSLRYSNDDPSPALELIKYFVKEDYASEIRDEISGRFAGNAGLTLELERFLSADEGSDPEEQILRQHIKSEPAVWEYYEELGTLLIEKHGDYAQAAKIFMSFPGFADPISNNSVELANRAYRVGSALLQRGEPELAKPLYELAASYDNGSAASMYSAYYIALLGHQYKQAVNIALQIAQRYDSANAYRDYLSLLHVLDHSEEAWSGFMQLHNHYKTPQVWMSAYVGHRVNAKNTTELKKWLLSDIIRNSANGDFRFAAWYTVLWNLTDRAPNDDLASLILSLEGPSEYFLGANGISVLKPVPEYGPGYTESIRRSAFRSTERPKGKSGAKVESELVLFAKAVNALKKDDFKDSMMLFDNMASYYAVEDWKLNYVLPYFAFASAKSGDPIKLEEFITKRYAESANFYSNLSLAVFAGLNNRHDVAEKLLGQAFNLKPHLKSQPLTSGYQYAEACIWLFDATGYDGYRQRALQWARKHQQIQPTHPWAYALEAAYSDDGDQRVRATAFTLFLDKESEWLKKVPESVVQSARVWLESNNPFQQLDTAHEEGVNI